MAQEQHLMFGPFQLDPVNARLWRDGIEVGLRPKAFAMLRYLVEHPGRLVTKAELLKVVWAGTYVTPTVFRVCLHEIRAVLREDATAPHFIETIPRQGYRFIAPVTTSGLVGRGAELGQLRHWFEKALGGERQIVFVTGEAGIGKTTLVDAFLAKLGARAGGEGTRDWGLGTGFFSPQAPSPKPLVPKEVAREAEECFHKAIAIACRQGAKSLELRAVMSLSRLWQQQGRKEQAHQMLAEIYGWFTEGFDTADLQEARALLEA